MPEEHENKQQLVKALNAARHRVAELEALVAGFQQTEQRLTKINKCFLGFGQDPTENIQQLTALCGQLLNATCALYNRLEHDMLCSTGQWHTPPDYAPVDKAKGHICYDVIRQGGDQPLVVRNLAQTPYAETDPNVSLYHLETYVGKAVKCNNVYIGSLCAVFQEDFVPSKEDQELMGIIAAAIGVEEERRLAEAELKMYRNQLEVLIKERTTELTNANEQLQQEIAERQQVEKALRDSELRYRQLVENAGDIIWRSNDDGRLTYVNPITINVLGYTENELLGQRFTDFVRPDHRQEVKEFYETQRSQHIPNTYLEFPIHTKDGLELWLGQKVQLLTENEQVMGYQALARDITERMWAEEALKESEARYRSLFDGIPIGLYRTTPEGEILNANLALVQMLRYPDRDALIEANAFDFYEDVQERRVWLDQVAEQKIVRGHDVQLHCHDGTVIWVRDNAQAIHNTTGEVVYYEGTLENITERKQVEQEIRRRTAQLEALRALGLELATQLDLETLLHSIVSRAIELIGGTAGGLYLYRADQELLEWVVAVGSRVMPLGNTIQRGEGLSGKVWETGAPLIVEDYLAWEGRTTVYAGYPFKAVIGVPIHRGEQFLGVINVMRDTPDPFSQADAELLSLFATQAAVALENARLFEALRESEAKNQAILDALPDPLFLLARDSTHLDYHAPAQERLFLQPDQFLGKQVTDVLPTGVAEKYQQHIGRALGSGEMQVFEYQLEFPQEGNQHYEARMVVSGIDTVLAIVRNITEQRRIEAALRRRVRELAALQETVLEITAPHDLPNLLETIVERAAALLDGSGGGLYLCDPDQKLVRCVVSYNTLRDYTGTALEYGTGAAGTVAQTGEPLIIDDYRTWDKRASSFEEDKPFSTLISAPMKWQGQVTGVIHILGDLKSRRFTQADLELLTLFANHATLAVENARLYDQAQKELDQRIQIAKALQQRNRQLALLNQAGRALSSTLDLDQVLVAVLEEVSRLLDITGCSVWLADTKTEECICWQATGPQSELVRGWRLAPGQGIAGWVVKNGKSLIIPDVDADRRHYTGVDEQTGIKMRSILSSPLRIKHKVIGALQLVDTDVDHFKATDLTLVEPLASTAAIAIENARLYEQARQDAKTKSVLLNEVSHRVKNNLSAIIGLLYTEKQHADIQDRALYQSIMQNLINRVRSLSIAHSLLAASEWAPVRLSELVAQVIRSSLQALPRGKHIAVKVSPSAIKVPPDQAHQLALVVNELATNTIKHTLPERDKSCITASFSLDGEVIQFQYRDDGSGYPEKVLRLEQQNVGFDLITSIVRDSLHGELTLHNDQGAVAVIRFGSQLELNTENKAERKAQNQNEN